MLTGWTDKIVNKKCEAQVCGQKAVTIAILQTNFITKKETKQYKTKQTNNRTKLESNL